MKRALAALALAGLLALPVVMALGQAGVFHQDGLTPARERRIMWALCDDVLFAEMDVAMHQPPYVPGETLGQLRAAKRERAKAVAAYNRWVKGRDPASYGLPKRIGKATPTCPPEGSPT